METSFLDHVKGQSVLQTLRFAVKSWEKIETDLLTESKLRGMIFMLRNSWNPYSFSAQRQWIRPRKITLDDGSGARPLIRGRNASAAIRSQ